MLPVAMRYRRWMIPFFLLSLVSFAHAQPSVIWNCTLHTALIGDGLFFRRNGRDSWNGQGYLECFHDRLEVGRSVDITFNSDMDGYGVNNSSRLILTLEMVTTTTPRELTIYSPVRNFGASHGALWRIESDASYIEATVTTSGFQGIQRSLGRGTLFIR